MAGASGLADSVRSRADIPSGPLLVALSGGADSAVLAWVVTGGSGTVRAVFVDHGLAGSAGLQLAAAHIANVLGISLDVVEAPVARDTPSFEDAARTARYAALLATAEPDELILTGHTADDQAETVLGNFLRGAGAGGLAGIPSRRGRLARPLLAVTRAETRALAGELGLPFADDPDNQSTDLRRNRLRLELIPHLEDAYNPQFRMALGRTAAVMAADDAALEALAARVPISSDGEVVTLPAAALAVLPEAVASRVVRRAIREMRGPHAGSHEEVAAVGEVAAGRRIGAQLTGAVRVEREGPLVVLSGGDRPPVVAVSLQVPAELWFDRWRLTFTVSPSAPAPRPLGARTLTLDADRVGSALVVGPPGSGDRIEIGTGSKAVREALAECGVPRRLRARWPVVACGDGVAVIPGVRVAAWARPGPATTRYLVAHMDIHPGDRSPTEGS